MLNSKMKLIESLAVKFPSLGLLTFGSIGTSMALYIQDLTIYFQFAGALFGFLTAFISFFGAFYIMIIKIKRWIQGKNKQKLGSAVLR